MHRNIAVALVRFSVAVPIFFTAGVASAQNVKVACIGDSITALPTSWCGDLSTKLGAGYTVSNFGVSGTNLAKGVGQPYWSSVQYTPSHTFAPDIVIIMLGTNDAFPANWSSAKSHFVADYEELLGTYTSLASKPKPYIIVPTPIGASPFGHDGNLLATEVVPLVKQVAMEKMVPSIDAFTLFGGAMFDASLYSSASDQVHPNAKGQQMIADEVYKVLMSPGGSGNAGSGGATAAGGASGSGGATSTGGTAGGFGGAPGANAGGAAGMAVAGTGGAISGGVGGGGGTMSASGAGTGASTAIAGGASAAGGTSSVGGPGSPATAGNTSSGANPIGAAGMGAPAATASQSDGGGCQISGNLTSKHTPAAVLALLLGSVLIRSRKRNERRRCSAKGACTPPLP
jgi:lysophospholipase L1-like esterase